VVKTHETGEIVVSLDTRNFSQRKDATITVEFQFEKMTSQGLRRSPTKEVRLQTYAYIRQDVVLKPGSAQFGSVREGTACQKQLTLNYAGSSTWMITGINCQNPHVEVTATETGREHGMVSYLLTFDLKGDAPAGYIHEHVTLMTNDENPNAQRVLVAVEGLVEPAVSVSPSPLSFGVVDPDKPVVKNIVVTADAPFNVVDVKSADARFKFTLDQQKAKKAHLVRVEFTPDARRGPIDGKITIQTDIANHETVELAVNGQVGSTEEETPDTASP